MNYVRLRCGWTTAVILTIVGGCVVSTTHAAPEQAFTSHTKIVLGWKSRNAELAVIETNKQRWAALGEADAGLVQQELRLLRQLAPSHRAGAMLEIHPEAAFLCVFTREADRLAGVLERFNDAETRRRLLDSFARYSDPLDARNWVLTLELHDRAIAALLMRSPVYPVAEIFRPVSAETKTAECYVKWLNRIFAPEALSKSDEELAMIADFTIRGGPVLWDKLHASPTFRDQFLEATWPRMLTAYASERSAFQDEEPAIQRETMAAWWLVLAEAPEIWDLFADPDGERLFANGGMDAALWLFGSGEAAVHSDLRNLAKRCLLKGDPMLVSSLVKYSHEAMFRRLVAIVGETVEDTLRLCHRLDRKGDEWKKDVQSLQQITATGLREELNLEHFTAWEFVPGYGTITLLKKMAHGRPTSGGDIAGAAFDILSFIPIAKGGQVVVKGGGKVVAQRGIEKKLAQAGANSLEVAKAATESLTKRMSKETAAHLTEAASKGEAPSQLTVKALSMLGKESANALIHASMIDITTPVQWAFKTASKVGANRGTFRRLTDLEARWFMRKDARVLICPLESLLQKAPPAVTAEFAENAMREAAETGTVQAWQRNASAWWSGLSTGAIEVKP